jgi:hypothetical protein
VASWDARRAKEDTNVCLPDPRPQRRHKASQSETAALKAHFAHATCVSCGLAYQHRHHIAFRKADSGDDIPVNIAPLCLQCHDLFHSRAPGWERVAAAIRQYVLVDNDRRRYAEEKLGEKFGRRYPPLPHSPQVLEDFRVINESHISEAVEGWERT